MNFANVYIAYYDYCERVGMPKIVILYEWINLTKKLYRTRKPVLKKFYCHTA